MAAIWWGIRLQRCTFHRLEFCEYSIYYAWTVLIISGLNCNLLSLTVWNFCLYLSVPSMRFTILFRVIAASTAMYVCLIFNQISEALFPCSINESSEFITIQYIIFDENLDYLDAKISIDSIKSICLLHWLFFFLVRLLFAS